MFDFKNKLFRYFLQAVNYSIFMWLIWFLSTSPSYRQLADDEAVLTISFAHAGEIREPCHKRTQKELMKLSPNMRAPMDCTRERSPIIIEVLLDGAPMYTHTAEAPGLFKDSGVDIYHSVKVSAGRHNLAIKMDDSVLKEGFNHSFNQDIDINPAQILLIGFEFGQGFVIK
ncbi:MAG: hypothetical protein OEY06_03750 [Gammaproteobacteria bacterium]|nr:hypothetical protein [Gammaproteobacteria bacterium]MDH5387547.1 hypothetical protein [Gammaproteobacteria bacterium]